MSSPRDQRPPPGDAEEEFVERLAAEYAPPPMSAAKRVAFDEALRERLERPRRRWLLAPAFAGAAAAAALIWLAVAGPTGPVQIPGEEESEREFAGSWEDALFLSSELSSSEDRVESGTLPADYLAIASLLVDE